MSDVTVELVYGGAGPPDGEIAVVRLLGRLPGDWDYAQEHVGPVRIGLRITAPDTAPDTGPAAVERAVLDALDDPALHHWRLLTVN